MANVAAVSGVREILANLAERNKRMAAGANRGLRLAGLLLQRESQRIVPVNFGVLKNSAFTRATGDGFKTEVNVGYTASYAMFVHENVEMKLRGLPRQGKGAKGKYWDPQGRGQAKFLEEPARRLGPAMKKIILDNTRII